MNELFNDLPDVLDAKALAHALSILKSGAYTLLNQKDFPTLRISDAPDWRKKAGHKTRSHLLDG